MKFKSKIDWWLYLIFVTMLLINLMFIALFIIHPGTEYAVCSSLLLLINIIIIIPIWTRTYYVLGDDELYIKCGFCISKQIAYNAIRSVKETRNPLASSGLSLDRIEIIYAGGGVVLISPQNKQEFLRLLAEKRSGV